MHPGLAPCIALYQCLQEPLFEKLHVFMIQDAKAALEVLANSYKAEKIGEHCYHLYEQFRPTVASGQKGWGQKGQLDLMQIRQLAEQN